MFRKIYYDKLTGNVLYHCSYNENFIETSFDEDYQVIKDLNVRDKESIGLIKLQNGEYEQDFAQCNGFRVNPQTLELEFSYPDPNITEPQESVYRKPLSEELEETKQAIAELTLLLAQMQGGM